MNANLVALFDLYPDAFFGHEAIYAGYYDGLISAEEGEAIIDAVDQEVRAEAKLEDFGPILND